jgi:hypothetical protein
MITHKEILDYCNYLINKDQVADPISPAEYNAIIPIVNIEVYNREKKRLLELAGGQHMKFVELIRESYLQDVKKDDSDAPSGGSNYFVLAGDADMVLSARGMKQDGGVKINIVSDDKAFEMANGMFDSDDIAYAYIIGRQIHFSTSFTNVTYVYLAIPEKPVFDYYIDSDGNSQYMPVGSEVSFNTINYDVINSDGSLVAANIEYPKTHGYLSKS